MSATEESLAQDIGAMLSGQQSVAPDPVQPFEFDAAFQTKIAALSLRDATFNERVDGLVSPEHFENVTEATLVNIAQKYFAKYRQCPDNTVLVKLVKDEVAANRIRSDMKAEVVSKLSQLIKADLSGRDYVVDQVSAFAQHQALGNAIMKSVDYLEKRDFSAIEASIKKALTVGAMTATEYDFFAEIGSRTAIRCDQRDGKIQPSGVTTGIKAIDELLYHKGWGRSELSIWMGGAKTGKTTALINSAIYAVAAGFNVLYVTLEVSKEIMAARADAAISKTMFGELQVHPENVEQAVVALGGSQTRGDFKIHEFPSGSWTPRELRRLIQHYKAKGVMFDAVYIDYLDIMAPDMRMNDEIANSKNVWVGVRAVAQEEGFAVISATQTNRDGFKADVAKAEHVAEDFNKIRIADLVISINKTEEEQQNEEARLYFAASRNQAGGFTIKIKQDLARMQFCLAVLGAA